MRKLFLSTVFAVAVSGSAHAACSPPLSIKDGAGATQTLAAGCDGANTITSSGSSFAITNPTSTLTLPATTTAYAAGTAIASSATAGSVVVPFFSIPNTAGGAYVPGLFLTTNDPAWAGAIVQVDTWVGTAPTLANGDRGAYLVSTFTQGSFAGSYSCTLAGSVTGAYGACAPIVGTTPAVRLASGTSVFWTHQAVTGTAGVTVSSGVFTLKAQLSN